MIIRYLLEGFGKLGGEPELQIIANHLNDKNLSLRLAAIHSVGEMGTDQAMGKLKELLIDENLRVRGAAASVLCDKGSLKLEPYLRELVERGERDCLLVALRIIRKSKKPSQYHDLIKEIYDSTDDGKVRAYAQEVEASLRRDGQLTQRKVTQAFKWPFDISDTPSSKDPKRILIGVGVLVVLVVVWLVFG